MDLKDILQVTDHIEKEIVSVLQIQIYNLKDHLDEIRYILKEHGDDIKEVKKGLGE